MDTPQDINYLIKQTRQYEFEDGLRDLQIAVWFASLGVTSWLILDLVYLPYIANLMRVFGKSALWLSLFLLFFPTVLGLILLRIIDYIRRRWLWHNSGIVKPLSQMVPRWVSIIATLLSVLSIVLVFTSQRADPLLKLQMIVVAPGWSTGIMLAGLGYSIGLSRYVWLGLIGGLGSTFLLFTKLTFGQTAMAFGLSWGSMFAVVGIVVLCRFLVQARGTR